MKKFEFVLLGMVLFLFIGLAGCSRVSGTAKTDQVLKWMALQQKTDLNSSLFLTEDQDLINLGQIEQIAVFKYVVFALDSENGYLLDIQIDDSQTFFHWYTPSNLPFDVTVMDPEGKILGIVSLMDYSLGPDLVYVFQNAEDTQGVYFSGDLVATQQISKLFVVYVWK